MTDLCDTTPLPVPEEPRRVRWLPICLAAVSVVGASLVASFVLTTRAAPAAINSAFAVTSTSVLSTIDANSATSPQVASSPPVVPCLSWSFGPNSSEIFSIGGSPCVNASVIWAGATAAAGTLPASPTALGEIVDPLLDTTSTVTPGQIYDGIVAMPERDPSSGRISVVARSSSTFLAVWSRGCDDPTATPAVHFSGGQVSRDTAANRTDLAVYGYVEYVAVSCGGTMALYNPITGAPI